MQYLFYLESYVVHWVCLFFVGVMLGIGFVCFFVGGLMFGIAFVCLLWELCCALGLSVTLFGELCLEMVVLFGKSTSD